MTDMDFPANRSFSPGRESSRAKSHHMNVLYGDDMNVTGPRPMQAPASLALEQYRLQLYNYALNIERLRCPPYTGNLTPWLQPYGTNTPGANSQRLATLSSISLLPPTQRIFQPEEPKPQHSYIGLIAMAILGSPEFKLVLSDIYQYILDNYPYFRTRGPGWRNSIRHNLSLNDCFIKSGRSANGKGHYWAIHPANIDDFRKGDFRRRKAQRKVRKHMGLAVDDTGNDSPSPPPLDLTTPPLITGQGPQTTLQFNYPYQQHYIGQFFERSVIAASLPQYPPAQAQPASTMQPTQHQTQQHQHIAYINSTTTTTIANLYSQTRKRQFDVASLLAPDVQLVDIVQDRAMTETASGRSTTQTLITKLKVNRELLLDLEPNHSSHIETDNDGDIDVVDASDAEEQVDNLEYLNSTIRCSFEGEADTDADVDNDIDTQTARSYAPSMGSSCSQHDSNSLEECTTERLRVLDSTPTAQPNVQQTMVEELQVQRLEPTILSRYYGTYVAAAAARMNLEANNPISPSIELVHEHS